MFADTLGPNLGLFIDVLLAVHALALVYEFCDSNLVIHHNLIDLRAVGVVDILGSADFSGNKESTKGQVHGMMSQRACWVGVQASCSNARELIANATRPSSNRVPCTRSEL